MLGQLDLQYWQFVSLTAMAFVARVAVLPTFGRFARTRGSHVLLWLGAVAIVPLPSLWLVSHEFWYLLLLQVLAGTAWAALELASMLAVFDGIDDSDRASVLSVFNLVNAAAIATGAFGGARVLAWMGTTPAAYASLFVISSIARVLVIPLLVGTRGAAHAPAGVQLRTLAVRPALGAIQRPILPSLGDDAPEAPAPRSREG
jgi:MFS family permease